MAKKNLKKHDPLEVEHILRVAQGKNEEIPDEYSWIGNLSQKEAVDILIDRFQSLIASLVDVCHKGRYFTSYTKTFLSLWASKGVPFENTAKMLKIKCEIYTKEELFHAGKVATLKAIEACEKNLASSIVYAFKDEIALLTNKERSHFPLSEIIDSTHGVYDDYSKIELESFLDNLLEEDQIIVLDIIKGNSVSEIPEHLRLKIITFLQR